MEKSHKINKVLFTLIICLGCLSGFYTYTGMSMIVSDNVLSMVFAIAIQTVLAFVVLSFPYSSFPVRVISVLFYCALFVLSTGTSYIYIYNSQQKGIQDNLKEKRLIVSGTEYLEQTLKYEKVFLNEKVREVKALEAQANQEKQQGAFSKRGPGEGPVYIEMIEELSTKDSELAEIKSGFTRTTKLYSSASKSLMNNTGGMKNYVIAQWLAKYRGSLQSFEAKSVSVSAVDALLEEQKTPVEVALSVFKMQDFSWEKIISLLWASFFDISAFVLGLIWYSVQTRSKNFIEIVKSTIKTCYGLLSVVSDVKAEIEAEKERFEAIDQTDIMEFAASIFATCKASGNYKFDDTVKPLKDIFSLLEPLNYDEDPTLIGIPYKSLGVGGNADPVEGLKPIMAILVHHGLFKSETQKKAFILDKEQKVNYNILIYMMVEGNIDKSVVDKFYPKIIDQSTRAPLEGGLGND